MVKFVLMLMSRVDILEVGLGAAMLLGGAAIDAGSTTAEIGTAGAATPLVVTGITIGSTTAVVGLGLMAHGFGLI